MQAFLRAPTTVGGGSPPREISVEPLSSERLSRAKRAFTTRRVDVGAMRALARGALRPRSGDLVLARVHRIGQHRRLELTDGRRARLHLDDEIVVAYADRYAPDQFESHVPMRLGPTQLVASGGVASEMLTHSRDVRRATDIVPIGLVADDRGQPLNVADVALATPAPPSSRPPTIAIVGTSMNAGKTTTAHRIVQTLVSAGRRPGATKVTGTGSGGDYWVMLDAGAHRMLDFTDVGLASTYRVDFPLVERKAIELLDHLTESSCGAIVVEVADGVFQRETAKLLESTAFRARLDGIVVAAADAMGAVGTLAHLRRLDLPVVAIAGRLTRSPLAMREAAALCDVPILTLEDLSDPAKVDGLFYPGEPVRSGPTATNSLSFNGYETAPMATAVLDLTKHGTSPVIDVLAGRPNGAGSAHGNGHGNGNGNGNGSLPR